jgi:hypothetical protein
MFQLVAFKTILLFPPPKSFIELGFFRLFVAIFKPHQNDQTIT